MDRSRVKTVNIVVLGFDGALATAITGVIDLLALAGVTYNRIMKQPIQPMFNVTLVGAEVGPIRCINGINLYCATSFDQCYQWDNQPDAIIVPTIGGALESVLAQNTDLLDMLKWGNRQGLVLGANCTGNFFLAEAGILNGKQATTHWGFKQTFEQAYPEVDLQAERLLTKDGNVLCAGGGLAWFDLGLVLIELYAGYDVAIQTAKAFVIDYRRESQLSYSLTRFSPSHQDALVTKVQHYLDTHFADVNQLDALATEFSVSKRTLIRRFKSALATTPHAYLQNVRIEAAQKYLAETQLNIDDVLLKTGYEDMSAFRRVFKQHTGLTPVEYRRRFARRL